MFEVGRWVIDTKRKIAPTVCAVIQQSIPTIYVLHDDEADEYYMSDESNLIEYDKYWFDNQEKRGE